MKRLHRTMTSFRMDKPNLVKHFGLRLCTFKISILEQDFPICVPVFAPTRPKLEVKMQMCGRCKQLVPGIFSMREESKLASEWLTTGPTRSRRAARARAWAPQRGPARPPWARPPRARAPRARAPPPGGSSVRSGRDARCR